MNARFDPRRRPETEISTWEEYDRRKREFLRLNPEATDRDYELACIRFADELGL